MLVTLVSQKKTFSLHLPEKVSGKYWFTDEDRPLGKNRLLSIEADEDTREWVIREDRYVKPVGRDQSMLSEIRLKEGEFYPILLGIGKEKTFLFAEPFTEDRSTYRKYVLSGDTVINIGKGPDNQIVIENAFVSTNHAQLAFRSGRWVLASSPQTNGTYVNKHRVDGQMELKTGDTIFIMGCKIVIGGNFISVNNPDHTVKIDPSVLKEYSETTYIDNESYIYDPPEYYYRSPRFRREIEPLMLEVDAPTQKEEIEDTPIIVTILPSLLMGVGSFSTGIFSIINASSQGRSLLTVIPTMIMSVSMLIGMVLFPFIMKGKDKKRKIAKEKERRERYLKYLGNLRNEITKYKGNQEALMREDKAPILERVSQSSFWERRLWENTLDQSDFLYLRLGAGNTELVGEIKFPADRFSIDDDILRDELLKFQNEEHLLINVPVGLSLMQERVVGIVGDRQGVLNAVNNILLQLFLLHSYDEVKLICIYDEGEEEKLSYVRYAQHLWDNTGKERYLAVTEEDLRELSIRMNGIIRERMYSGEKETNMPEYILLSTSKALANKCAFMEDMLEKAEMLNFAVICAYDNLKDLPKECHAVVEINGNQGMIIDRGINRKKTAFVQDTVTVEMAAAMVQKMASKALDLNRGRYDLPGMLSFMDMFGVGKCEHLNIMQRWKRNDPIKSLQTPIGVDTNGEIFYLDLHEKFHGPHGLVAGMTGSGKSEFIITYILSMAVNYHPDEVAFILIDYKGGGLTGAFENEKYRLPHLAGTITNLDSNAITRSILSIRSELRNRQIAFNKAREIANEGTMDIYKYQKMYREGLVKEAMPHLIIISDEFAELKSQQPEFLDQLISTARIGRSLGVHLILATQKPAGVVNDQIWANSKFKVCLKVQDRADSMDMIKRPDAAEIAETGRFFLQVGYDELFEKGQSSWTGAPYPDADVSGTEPDSGIEVLDDLGNVTDHLREKKVQNKEDHGKQIVRIMDYLNALATEEGIHERQLWMPELSTTITIDELIRKYDRKKPEDTELRAVVGEVDDPYHQTQRIMEIDLSGGGNVLVYGSAASGYETVLYAILYSLYSTYSPELLNTYLLDFGSETLKMFQDAPQTAEVILDADTEKLDRFIRLVLDEIRVRKKKLASYGGDLQRYNRAEEEKLPFIFVMINNYAHFLESSERYEDTMISITREGAKYGIYFLVTAATSNSVRYRLVQNFSQIYVMQMNDRDDYLSILGRTDGVYPANHKGSGIFKTDETYSFQAGRLFPEDVELWDGMKGFCENLNEKYQGKRAKRIPVVPKFISGISVRGKCGDIRELPIGFGAESMDYICMDMSEENILLSLSVDPQDSERYVGGLMEASGADRDLKIIAFNTPVTLAEKIGCEYESVPKAETEQRLEELFKIAVDRHNDYVDHDGVTTVDMSPMLIVFFGFGTIKRMLSEQGKDKITAMLKRVEGYCNIRFLICDSQKAYNGYNIDPWIDLRTGGGGVWVGEGVNSQYCMDVSAGSGELNNAAGAATGFSIRHGVAKTMRLILPEMTMKEVEDEQ